MKEIRLTQGKVALVDDCDYEYLSQFRWHAAKNCRVFYAARGTFRGGKGKSMLMHRVILAAQKGEQVDHIDHDGLNNRRDNLRICTTAQNAANKRKDTGTISLYKGVDWHKGNKAWRARVSLKGKRIEIGHFHREEDAARTYDAKAKELFGQFASLNFPPEKK